MRDAVLIPQEQLLHPEFARPRVTAETVERTCLRCRKPFDTTRYVRVCAPCKKTDDWS